MSRQWGLKDVRYRLCRKGLHALTEENILVKGTSRYCAICYEIGEMRKKRQPPPTHWDVPQRVWYIKGQNMMFQIEDEMLVRAVTYPDDEFEWVQDDTAKVLEEVKRDPFCGRLVDRYPGQDVWEPFVRAERGMLAANPRRVQEMRSTIKVRDGKITFHKTPGPKPPLPPTVPPPLPRPPRSPRSDRGVRRKHPSWVQPQTVWDQPHWIDEREPAEPVEEERVELLVMFAR